jgi:hypothetical protein
VEREGEGGGDKGVVQKLQFQFNCSTEWDANKILIFVSNQISVVDISKLLSLLACWNVASTERSPLHQFTEHGAKCLTIWLKLVKYNQNFNPLRHVKILFQKKRQFNIFPLLKQIIWFIHFVSLHFSFCVRNYAR